MVRKIADDYEAIRAGEARLEAERLWRLNGGSEPMPEALPIEAYEGAINYEGSHTMQSGCSPLPVVDGSHWFPWGASQPHAGATRFFPDGSCLVWNNRAWVTEEEWQDKGVQS